MNYRITAIIGAFFLSLFIANPIYSAGYPDRPITLMTMVQAGAQIDLLTRGISRQLSEELGVPVTVRNRPGGAHGSVMASELRSASPDGYTFGIAATTAYTYAPHFMGAAYDTFEDYDFITLVALNSSGYVTHPDRPWDTLREAFEWAAENDESLVYNFHGTDDRDAFERMAQEHGVKYSLMPSEGGPSVIRAVRGGHADIGYLGAILFEHVEAGRLKLLASALSERLPPISDVPTLQEQGYDETVEMFVVMVAPKDVPEERMAVIEDAMMNLAEKEEMQAFITDELLMQPVEWGREQAEARIKGDYERFKGIAEASE